MTNLKSLFRFFSAPVKLQPLYIGKLFCVKIKKITNSMYTVPIELHVHVLMLSIQSKPTLLLFIFASFYTYYPQSYLYIHRFIHTVYCEQ